MKNYTFSKRSAARLVAVQTLYSQEIERKGQVERTTAESADDTLFVHSRIDSKLELDNSFLSLVIEGVNAQQEEIDALISEHLATNWKLDRLDTVQRALLRAGVFELRALRDIEVATIINEYVELSHAFFEDEDSKFVNAILDKIAKKIRVEE